MTTHVALLASDEIYDGHSLREEIYSWLIGTVGRKASDMTELQWTKKAWLMTKSYSRFNPKYITPSARDTITMQAFDAPLYLHFQFRSPAHATMFKLAWGGKCS